MLPTMSKPGSWKIATALKKENSFSLDSSEETAKSWVGFYTVPCSCLLKPKPGNATATVKAYGEFNVPRSPN